MTIENPIEYAETTAQMLIDQVGCVDWPTLRDAYRSCCNAVCNDIEDSGQAGVWPVALDAIDAVFAAAGYVHNT